MWYRNICALRQSKFCKGTKVSEADSEVCGRACHELTVPEHGNITFSKGIAVTSVANITCQPPYILLSGSELRTCVQGRTRGTWNGTQPTCVKHPCELHQCETHERCVLNERNNTECVCGDECPRPQGDEWVCGTDGKSYPSRCHVKLRACQNSTPFLQPSYAGKCNPDEFPRKRKR
ncbi:Follistatin [Geodia barretti]|nr:Follistatin [Geodia barretti]